MSVMQVIAFHPCNKFEIFGRYGAFSVSALFGPVTLTFDLSTSKWVHGSPITFSLLSSSVLDLGLRTAQTDIQTGWSMKILFLFLGMFAL